MSGRYRVEALSGHWIPWNREGYCTLPGCWKTSLSHKGTVETFLVSCPSLSSTRQYLEQSICIFLQSQNSFPILESLVYECIAADPVQFWLDCSSMPSVISAVQVHGEDLLTELFKITRNYCHVLHKTRKAMLDQNII